MKRSAALPASPERLADEAKREARARWLRQQAASIVFDAAHSGQAQVDKICALAIEYHRLVADDKAPR